MASNFGIFAGGAAQGAYMGLRLKQQQEEHDWRKEDRARAEGMRREAGNAFGSVGQPREDGSLYTEEDAYGDFAKNAARYDPQAAMQARTQGLQQKAAKLNIQGLERGERYARNEEDTMALLRRIQALPDDQYYREVAKFATRYGNDGKSFGVDFDQNDGYKLTMVSDGMVRSMPVQDRKQVERMLMSYASPKFHQQSEEAGLKDRQVGAAERTAAATEGYRRDQGPLLAAQADAERARAGAYRALASQRDRTAEEKMPEGDRILLMSRERQQQVLMQALGKAEPGQDGPIRAQLMRLQREEYDHLKKLKLIPPGVSKTQYLGLPDPLQVARDAMAGAQTEQQMLASLDQFDQLYGDAPEAGYARNAMQVFLQQNFYNRVRPQNAPGSGLTRTFRQGGEAMGQAGLTSFPMMGVGLAH